MNSGQCGKYEIGATVQRGRRDMLVVSRDLVRKFIALGIRGHWRQGHGQSQSGKKFKHGNLSFLPSVSGQSVIITLPAHQMGRHRN
jgi:hypothetical protein